MEAIFDLPITSTIHPALEHALREKLSRSSEKVGHLGELEPLAIRLGLIQASLKPRFYQPQLLVFAGDHGLAVERILAPTHPTGEQVIALVDGRLPLPVFARLQGVDLSIIDSGIAEPLPPHVGLLARKIAHGTRNCRIGPAMTRPQALAGVNAGREIAEGLPGNVLACAGMGNGSFESAALIIAYLTHGEIGLRQLLTPQSRLTPQEFSRQLVVLQSAQSRHSGLDDPIDVLAAFGGHEISMMVGALLVGASKRHLLIVDGLPACAALLIAARLKPDILDYVVFSRSHAHPGLTAILDFFTAAAVLELGMSSIDGTGSVLAWSLLRCAAALVADVSDEQGDILSITEVEDAQVINIFLDELKW